MPPSARPTFRVELTIDTPEGEAKMVAYEHVAGMQIDESGVMLGSQDSKPIAWFSHRILRDIQVPGNDVPASGIVLPFRAPGSRLLS